jgi:DNA invertase Pin-like site-specific DNA recombinase
MSELEIGYARVSTDTQGLARRDALEALGVEPERIYVDHRHAPRPAGPAPGARGLPRR